MNLRISAGKYKNKRLKVSRSARPVMERTKLAVFSIIGDQIIGKNCLDLYAGSGNLGLEALSRGAGSCTFIDSDKFAVEAILENIQNLDPDGSQGLSESTEVKNEEVLKFLGNTQEYYDVAFVDAPYDMPVNHLLKLFHESINIDGLLIFLHKKDKKWDIGQYNNCLKVIDSRIYGITQVDFMHRSC